MLLPLAEHLAIVPFPAAFGIDRCGAWRRINASKFQKMLELVYNRKESEASRLFLFRTEVVAMGEEDTVILTPEEKDQILQEVPEEEDQDDEDEEDQAS
jgi:hypothetical protein